MSLPRQSRRLEEEVHREDAAKAAAQIDFASRTLGKLDEDKLIAMIRAERGRPALEPGPIWKCVSWLKTPFRNPCHPA